MMPATAAKTTDFCTVLKAEKGLYLTKVWTEEGVKPYDDAKNFRIKEYAVSGIHDLHKLLVKLAGLPQCCIIRGKFIGEARAQEIHPPEKPGRYYKRKALFDEVAHHWMLTDIDGYRPEAADPVLEPVKAIDEYIANKLPPEFHGVSYVWQLSASAGAVGKEGLLKAHVWFWLEQPYTGPQLEAWARVTGAALDISVLRRVQPNYTAVPIFSAGLTDPVPLRMGFEAGIYADAVPLIVPTTTLVQARDLDHEREASEIELTDPKTKPGLIGLFCSTYSMEEVIDRWLPEVFEFQEGSERRLNYLLGGGSPGGAFVSDCREYIINTHNTDPMAGRATNKWDLVRHYVHGEQDAGTEAFELLDVSARPSHRAMLDAVSELPEIKEQLTERKAEGTIRWRERVAEVEDEWKLREVAAEIGATKGLDGVALETLARAIQTKFRELGQPVPIATVRGLLQGGRTGRGLATQGAADSSGAPDWARPWVYVTDGDCFFNLVTKEKVTERGFNALHTRYMHPWADPQTGALPPAGSFCLNQWDLATVSHLTYMPTADATFSMLGFTWANLYREDSHPVADEQWKAPGSEPWKAVETVKNHLVRFLPNDRERRLMTSWLAQNVQRPGVKIRWAPYIHGATGDGKSFFLDLLAATMGEANVRMVGGRTIESSGFTDWAVGYAVVGIEEMKLHGHNRYDVVNSIKPVITNSTIEVHPKGKASYPAPNTSNYIIFSNYLDGAPVDSTERRYMFMSSGFAAEELPALTQSGYFKAVFDTLSEHPGALRGWLLAEILDPEFDPNGRAPDTEIRRTVVELTRSDAESEAQDIVARGAEGVDHDVVSSPHLSNLLQGLGLEVKTNQVNSMLTKMGFHFLDRKKWKGRTCRVWVRSGVKTWEEAKPRLDRTVASEFLGAE